MQELVLNRLNELKKERPSLNLEVLKIENADLHINFITHDWSTTVMFGPVPYQGIVDTFLHHSWKHDTNTIYLIIDVNEFKKSAVLANQIFNEYKM